MFQSVAGAPLIFNTVQTPINISCIHMFRMLIVHEEAYLVFTQMCLKQVLLKLIVVKT